MGVCSAILNFNDGAQGLCNVTKNLGLKVGHFTVNACSQKDEDRISSKSIKQSEKGLKRRTVLRGHSKGWLDKEKEEEGRDSYSSGAFICLNCFVFVFVTILKRFASLQVQILLNQLKHSQSHRLGISL